MNVAVTPAVPEAVEIKLRSFPPLVRKLLFSRGIIDATTAENFLSPNYDTDIHDPFLLANMERAIERLVCAIRENERVVIFSDYDADGIPGAVVLHDTFRKLGFKNFEVYIPHREDEGFGLNAAAIEAFAASSTKVLITVDCGIADVEEIALARELGIDVIVTDHHVPPFVLPNAYALVNPKQEGCRYPEKMLCGAGVAFKLAEALLRTLRAERAIPIGWEKWLLDMVGIATLSDMVPLRGENRVLAHYGLKVLRKSPRVGLQKLIRSIGASQRYLTEDDIGFSITPRLNAASRMGEPRQAFNILSTVDEGEAAILEQELTKLNDERKGYVGALSKKVKHLIRERYGEEFPAVLVLGSPEWRPSLLGLLAGRLAEEYDRPIFLWGRNGDSALKGSCRSSGGVDVLALMTSVGEGIFADFGGHAASGGFTLTSDGVHRLPEALFEAVSVLPTAPRDSSPRMVDAALRVEEITWDFYRLLEQFAPFGVGNPKPTFLISDITVKSVRLFGKEKNHTEIVFDGPNGNLRAIAFFTLPDDFTVVPKEHTSIKVLGTLEKSFFRATLELRLRILDII